MQTRICNKIRLHYTLHSLPSLHPLLQSTINGYTVGFWGDINFFHEHRHDIPPMKIYNVGVCLVQFLKFFMEPFWRNCNFKILTLNPGFSALKCKNPLKSTIFIHFGHAIWQIRTIFHQKKDSGLILTALSEKNGEKCISS